MNPFFLINLIYSPELYGYERIMDFETMAMKGIILISNLTSFRKNLKRTLNEGDYFYSIMLFV